MRASSDKLSGSEAVEIVRLLDAIEKHLMKIGRAVAWSCEPSTSGSAALSIRRAPDRCDTRRRPWCPFRPDSPRSAPSGSGSDETRPWYTVARPASPTMRSVLLSFSVNSSGGASSSHSLKSPERLLLDADGVGVVARQLRPRRAVAPAPGVAEPDRGQQMQRRGSGPRLITVARIRISFDIVLGVFDEDVEIAIVVEDSGVDQLVFAVSVRDRARDWSSPGPNKETATADICTAPSCRSAWAWSPGSSNIP